MCARVECYDKNERQCHALYFKNEKIETMDYVNKIVRVRTLSTGGGQTVGEKAKISGGAVQMTIA